MIKLPRKNTGSNFINSIIKVSFSNIISLMSGVLVGFVVPKMMGLEGYANYKIYTLYFTYLALLSLGVGDGLYLKFSGIDRDKLDVHQIGHYLHVYYLQLIVFVSVACLFTYVFAKGEYRFILISLSLVIASSQITAIHQNLSIITSRFNEYSTRVITKSVLTSLLVILLFIIYRINGKEITYRLYIIGVVVIDYILAIWYIITYRDLNFQRSTVKKSYKLKYYELIITGFPLLLSNMAGTIFLNLDRQFVSLLFERKDYAIYAFAYNMLTLITTMTSAVSIVLFPSLKKIRNINIQSSFNQHFTMFTAIVPISLLVYFPLCYIVSSFLPKYIMSLPIFRIVLPGIMLSSSVSVILINYYKIENAINKYFVKTVFSIAISAALNYIAYLISKSYECISWASIISLMIWYWLVLKYFVNKYHITWKKNFAFLICCMIAFYLFTFYVKNVPISCMAYCIALIILIRVFYRQELYALINQIKRKD